MKTITINEKQIPVYCTMAEADQYFAEKFGSAVWDNTEGNDKEKALVQATRKLNTLKLQGFPVDSNQPLLFPRYFKPNFLSKRTFSAEAKSITVHGKSYIYIEDSEAMQMACAEEACAIIENYNSVHIKNQKLGISSINLDGAGSVSYNVNASEFTPETMAFVDIFLIKTAKVV